MKKLLLSIAALAVFALPATANAEQCRAMATGKFAKCGTAGAVPASQYVKKNGQAGKMMPSKAAVAKPAAAAPAAVAVKAGGPCKDGHGKFIKCGTVAAPAAAARPAPAPAAAKPATPAKAAGAAKKAACKDTHGKFIKCAA